MSIERLGPGDENRVLAATHLFDYPPRLDAVARFLADPNHHMLIAYSAGVPLGFVSGVQLTHPDKGTEMLLYELAVDDAHQRQGVGTALVQALVAIAREMGCYGMWVLTDSDNEAAAGTYRKAGGEAESKPVMFSWRFDQKP